VVPQIDPAKFDGQRALFEAQRVVALGARDAGTPGAKTAAEYLLRRLMTLGISAEIDVFSDMTPNGSTMFRNVVGTLPGTGSGLIILGSHYDTKSGIPHFVGANDSGSSCGALIELGRALKEGPRIGPTVQLVFFDGEECMKSYGPIDGFHGSRRHAAQVVRSGQASNVLAMILLDMIGDKNLTVTLPRNSTPALLNATLQAAHAEHVREHFSLHPFGVGDDHVAFLDAGMPAIDLIDFDFGSMPGLNDYWHTSQDTMDKISADSLQTIGRVTLRVVNTLLRDASKPPR